MGDKGDIQKHFKAGDAEPAINKSKYTLFGFRFCPYTDRVRLTLSFHKIDYDFIPIELSSKPDWFLSKSPSGKVPLLVYGGEKLTESDMIMKYVDQLHGPESSLISVCGENVFQNALDLSKKFFSPAHALLYKTTHTASEADAFRAACKELNSEIKHDFLAGNRVSLADLALFPMLDRFEVVLGVVQGKTPSTVCELKPDSSACAEWPKLVDYLCRMRQLPAIASTRQSVRVSALYAATYREGHPNPDIY